MIARLTLRHVVAALVALALIAVTAPANAQAPAPAPHQPSPAALLLAKQIIEVKGIKKVFEPLVRGVITKAKNAFLQQDFIWEKDIDASAEAAHKQYDSRLSELIDETARIYASHFTEAELKEILTFYQSPLGQKLIAEEPKALDESMANAGNWGDKLYQEVVTMMREEMRKRGHDM
jgi:hypothetical protein